ncbi:unnamed protein product [Cercopithifilaria johnstoni]|uniref:Uncharacterized protein n=1 Tax=Cercopithifilaria johnstoni TaxID=2874296 RepID=A0A8J2PWS3_9BILA|nr:unnamed protein product [Cercopithifilaria johnstoni]
MEKNLQESSATEYFGLAELRQNDDRRHEDRLGALLSLLFTKQQMLPYNSVLLSRVKEVPQCPSPHIYYITSSEGESVLCCSIRVSW